MTPVSARVPLLNVIKPGARGVIGALARSGDQVFAITARHLLGSLDAAAGGEKTVRDGRDLIGRVQLEPDHRLSGKVAYPWLRVDTDRLLGEGVYRLRADGLESPGQITALHGAVRLRDPAGGPGAVYADIVEVTFDEFRAVQPDIEAPRDRMPALSGDDAGTLVVTPEHAAVGIIIGGSGYRALLVPIWPYLTAHGLTLGAAKPDDQGAFDERSLALDWASEIDGLAREESLGLGDISEAA